MSLPKVPSSASSSSSSSSSLLDNSLSSLLPSHPSSKQKISKKTAISRSGYLKKKAFFGHWKEWFFSLEAGTLLEFKDSQAKKAERAFRLKEFTVDQAQNLTGVPNSFVLLNPKDNKTIFLAASSLAEMKEWIGALRAHCKRNEFAATLENTLQAINDSAILTDESGIIQSLNQPAVEMFGYPKEELIGKDIKILMPKEYGDKHDEYMIHYKETNEKKLIGKPRTLPVVRKGGRHFLVEVSLGELQDHLSKDGRVFFLGTMRQLEAPSRSESNLSISNMMSSVSNHSMMGSFSNDSVVVHKTRSTEDLDLEKQIHFVMEGVRGPITDVLKKNQRKMHHLKSRNSRLKKKNNKLQEELVGFTTDLRDTNRALQIGTMAFYLCLSNSEADTEYEIVKYLKESISKEISECCNPGTLFRDESINNKKLAAFFLFQGSSFLMKILEKPIFDICNTNASYEIDRRLDPNATDEEIKAREKRILDGVIAILNEINAATKECPPAFGVLFRHVKNEVSKKFLPTSVDPYSIMSGFFYLRLLIPAIVQPQRYNLIPDRPVTQNAKRGLILISKILINMANGIIFSEGSYMEVFNKAISERREMLHNIFDDIIHNSDMSSSNSSSEEDCSLKE